MGFSKKCVFVLCILTSYVVFGQNGEFSGTIKLDTNEPVFGAHIVLNGANAYKKETVSGLDGEFHFKDVPYGDYIFEINSLNAKQKKISATLHAEKKHIDIALNNSDY